MYHRSYPVLKEAWIKILVISSCKFHSHFCPFNLEQNKREYTGLSHFVSTNSSQIVLHIIPIKETVLPHMWSWFLHLETALFWIHLSRSHPQSDHHCNQCQVSCESKCSIRRYFHQFPQQFLEEIAKQQHQKEISLLTLY